MNTLQDDEEALSVTGHVKDCGAALKGIDKALNDDGRRKG